MLIRFALLVTNGFSEPKNPFKQLIDEFADRFVKKFGNPEEAVLDVVKKYASMSLSMFSFICCPAWFDHCSNRKAVPGDAVIFQAIQTEGVA